MSITLASDKLHFTVTLCTFFVESYAGYFVLSPPMSIKFGSNLGLGYSIDKFSGEDSRDIELMGASAGFESFYYGNFDTFFNLSSEYYYHNDENTVEIISIMIGAQFDYWLHKSNKESFGISMEHNFGLHNKESINGKYIKDNGFLYLGNLGVRYLFLDCFYFYPHLVYSYEEDNLKVIMVNISFGVLFDLNK